MKPTKWINLQAKRAEVKGLEDKKAKLIEEIEYLQGKKEMVREEIDYIKQETIRKQQQLKEVRPVTIIKPIYPPHNVQGVDRYLRALGDHQLDWLVTRAMDIAEARINERLAERIRQVRAFSNKHFKFFFSSGGKFCTSSALN